VREKINFYHESFYDLFVEPGMNEGHRTPATEAADVPSPDQRRNVGREVKEQESLASLPESCAHRAVHALLLALGETE